MKNYLKLLRFLKDHIKLFIPATVLMFISAMLEGAQFTMMVPLVDIVFTQKKITAPDTVPIFVANLINRLNEIQPTQLLWILVVVFVPLIIFKLLVNFFFGFLMNDISQRIMRDIRNRLYEKIQSFSLDYFSQKRVGELISRITNDVQVIENALSYGITDLFSQTFMIVMYLVIVFTIHFKGALVIFLMLPFIAFPMSQIGRRLKKLSQQTQEKIADINSLLLETISGVKIVKAFSSEKYEIDRFSRQNRDYKKLKMKSIRRLLAINPTSEVVGTLFGTLMIIWFGLQMLNDEISFGVFGLFFGSIMMLMKPVKKLANVNAITQQALAASGRIHEILDNEPTVVEKEDASTLPTIQKQIQIKNVDFEYDSESGQVLGQIQLDIHVGDIVAIVGPTGSGKSTLANLIPRFYDPTKGEVAIDGINLKDVTFKSLRQQIGIVTQETFLFNDSVKANIAYGAKDATQEEIETAATRAFAHRFIKNLPRGYDTVIGDRGFRLSGGERQRVAIARAILKNPPILILDEATSALDSESEKFVQEALDQLMKGRTVICIAHRLSTIKKASKIAVIESGRMVGLDSHENLLKTCSLYKRLYETQFQM